MNDNIIKEVSVMIMDGSDNDKVSYIKDVVWEWSDPTVRQVMVYALDADHPSTIVIRTKINDASFVHMRDRIERRYPGLCTFNPPMSV